MLLDDFYYILTLCHIWKNLPKKLSQVKHTFMSDFLAFLGVVFIIIIIIIIIIIMLIVIVLMFIFDWFFKPTLGHSL